jgi:hypothetical protein
MAQKCTLVSAELLMGEMIKEFALPLRLWNKKTYRFSCKYGDNIVIVSTIDQDGLKLAEDVMLYHIPTKTIFNFNQFAKFIEDRMQLPDFSSLEVTVPSKGIVSCEVNIFPQKRVY